MSVTELNKHFHIAVSAYLRLPLSRSLATGSILHCNCNSNESLTHLEAHYKTGKLIFIYGNEGGYNESVGERKRSFTAASNQMGFRFIERCDW